MSACNFGRLIQLLDKQLVLNEQLEVFSHLDECDICRETIYLLRRDRDEKFFIQKPYHMPSAADVRRLAEAV